MSSSRQTDISSQSDPSTNMSDQKDADKEIKVLQMTSPSLPCYGSLSLRTTLLLVTTFTDIINVFEDA